MNPIIHSISADAVQKPHEVPYIESGQKSRYNSNYFSYPCLIPTPPEFKTIVFMGEHAADHSLQAIPIDWNLSFTELFAPTHRNSPGSAFLELDKSDPIIHNGSQESDFYKDQVSETSVTPSRITFINKTDNWTPEEEAQLKILVRENQNKKTPHNFAKISKAISRFTEEQCKQKALALKIINKKWTNEQKDKLEILIRKNNDKCLPINFKQISEIFNRSVKACKAMVAKIQDEIYQKNQKDLLYKGVAHSGESNLSSVKRPWSISQIDNLKNGVHLYISKQLDPDFKEIALIVEHSPDSCKAKARKLGLPIKFASEWVVGESVWSEAQIGFLKDEVLSSKGTPNFKRIARLVNHTVSSCRHKALELELI